MAAFPAWFAFQAAVTGGKGVVNVTDQAKLLQAELQAAPGRWKLFPYTPATSAAQLAAASKWAGVSDTAGGSPGESVPGTPKDALGSLGSWTLHTTGDFHTVLIRAAEIILGLLLIGIGLVKMSPAAAAAVGKVPVYGRAIKAVT